MLLDPDLGVYGNVCPQTLQRHVEDMYLIGGNTGTGWLRSVDIFTVRPPHAVCTQLAAPSMRSDGPGRAVSPGL